MPDQDIVERSLKKLWKRPYRLLKGGHPLEAVSDSLMKSLAETVREDSGVPGLREILPVSIKALTQPDGSKTLAEVCREQEQRLGQQTGVKIFARAAQANLADIVNGKALPGAPALIDSYLRHRVRHEFFSKIDYWLVGRDHRFADTAELRSCELQLWRLLEPKIKKIGADLATDPTASKLRAPKGHVHRRTTAQLIDAPLSRTKAGSHD